MSSSGVIAPCWMRAATDCARVCSSTVRSPGTTAGAFVVSPALKSVRRTQRSVAVSAIRSAVACLVRSPYWNGWRSRIAAPSFVDQHLQARLEVEATEVIGAGPYERSETRSNERNGSRPRLLATQAGDVELAIPKLRKGSFFPSIFTAIGWP